MHTDNRESAIREISHDEIRVYYDRARRLRAETLHDFAVRVGGAIAAGARRCVSAARTLLLAIAEARAAERTYSELSRLNDRELADIGLTRGEIPAVAWRRSEQAEHAVAPVRAEEEGEREYRLAA